MVDPVTDPVADAGESKDDVGAAEDGSVARVLEDALDSSLSRALGFQLCLESTGDEPAEWFRILGYDWADSSTSRTGPIA